MKVKREKESQKGKERGSALLVLCQKIYTNKLIRLCVRVCASRVKQGTVNEIQVAKSFSRIVDFCQDVGVVDRVVICVRYVKNEIRQKRIITWFPSEN